MWNIKLAGNQNGRPLLWFHGFMGSSDDWLPMVADLFPEYCNILVDLPGHGNSCILEQLSYTQYLDSLMAKLSTEGFETFVAIGYSMGGRFALHFQQRFPDNIPALIGLSTAPGLKTDAERQHRRDSDAVLMDALEQQSFSDFLMKWYAQSIFGSIQGNKDLLTKLLESRSRNEPSQLRSSLKLLGNGALPSLWRSLPSISIPVLLINGADDSKYFGINQEMIYLLPMGRQKTIAGGHAFHLEKPLETALAIRHFLSELIEGE
ncbi:MAG: alpha/beta fold hydrolase [Candidatus Marinimicrobia bacterium]|nr:alpha/beta fold hydrolase [Candidatus Neomarinimicrobiota bacterium]